jgi:acetyl-CoA carboxylase, biotin carboxylase subunit
LRLLSALNEVRVEGVKTNIALHRAVLAHPEFVAGGMDTGFLGRFLAETNISGVTPSSG